MNVLVRCNTYTNIELLDDLEEHLFEGRTIPNFVGKLKGEDFSREYHRSEYEKLTASGMSGQDTLDK